MDWIIAIANLTAQNMNFPGTVNNSEIPDKHAGIQYFYVLRPLLACKWIEQKKCPPTIPFHNLVDGVPEEDMKSFVSCLSKSIIQSGYSHSQKHEINPKNDLQARAKTGQISNFHP